ncbi:methyl-accepting chemotaxis protein [Thermosulfurimonas dismutans]|uniref:Methyl-accepting chemotaxis protein n=1 Tax=Thermosulfurimonas dismutans TaxID=999894 RepID=A0A179D1Q3_9BACT|nr:methyl-accepting chemotaxis protein [Thermosulfurimonas dismutans]OAQ19995.1 Methyl-accepting chemotaxis protein [Thermosulfurimonas dismutans]
MGIIRKLENSLKLWQKVAIGFLILIVLSLVNLGVLLVFQNKAERLNEKAQEVTEIMEALDGLTAYHIRWKVNLLTGLLNESTPQILTNPEKCPLKELFSRLEPSSPKEAELIKKGLELDRALHLSAAEIARLFEEEADYEDIVKVYNERTNPLSKKLFKLLDEMNEIYKEKVKRSEQEAKRGMLLVRRVAIGANLFLILMAILTVFFISRRLKIATDRVLAVVDRMAQGDFSQDIKVEGRDELAMLLLHLGQMLQSLRPLIREVTEGTREVESLAGEMSHLAEVAYQEGQAAGERATRMRKEAQAVLESVEAEAQSINEISSAIQEISQNTNRASMITKEAVEKAQRAQDTIHRLGGASQEIEDVIKIISGIAEQTKFLALNATIEAARAGEAGKGFAVVANEVKELARQTAEATGQITEKIRTMQAESEEAVKVADEIAQTIKEIDDIASAIAAAVEEQTAVITDIARSVEEQKGGAQRFAAEAEEAYEAAQKTLEGIDQSLEHIRKVAALVKKLAEAVSRFKV